VMCSGRPPFRAATVFAVLRRVVEDQPRPIQGIIPEVPQWMAAIIARLHAKNPDERFASAAEIASLLIRCLSELQLHGNLEGITGILPGFPQPEGAAQEPVTESREENGEPGVRPSRVPNRRWALAVAMLVMLLGGLGMTEATGVTNVR